MQADLQRRTSDILLDIEKAERQVQALSEQLRRERCGAEIRALQAERSALRDALANLRKELWESRGENLQEGGSS